MIKANNKLGDNTAKLPYRLVNNLLYFNNTVRGLRLCIPVAMEGEVFKLVYDKMGHPSYTRTHEKLTTNIYILNMVIKLYEYLRYYPHY